jgi:hypothetical protein
MSEFLARLDDSISSEFVRNFAYARAAHPRERGSTAWLAAAESVNK